MPLTAEHKQRSRQKILQSAFKLFTNQGFDNITIDQVMQDAGMTRGAFYAHFSSKEDLYKEAISAAAVNSQLVKAKQSNFSDKEWIEHLLSGYLSKNHIESKNTPCPLAFLTTDIAVRKPEIRDTYTNIYKNMNKRIMGYTKTYSDCDEQKMLAVTAMIIGGVSIARALNDDALTEQLLESCKMYTLELFD